VGTKAANELGIYDMSGNVFEWCSDWYGSSYPSGTINPTGATSGSDRVFRGGSWFYDATICAVSNRNGITPSYRNYAVGFRLVMSNGTSSETLAAPTNVSAALEGTTAIRISWSSVANATSYEVHRSSDNVTYALLQSGITATSYTDPAPQNGSNYYKVKAINAATTSSLSAASGVVVFNTTTFAAAVLHPESAPLTFSHPTTYPWVAADGYVKSGNNGVDNTSSYFTTSVEHTDSIAISFDWRAGSESNYDFFRFKINDEVRISHSGGTTNFAQYAIGLPAGSYTLRWEYAKDESASNNIDEAQVRLLKVAYKTQAVVPVTRVTLNKTTTTLLVNATEQLTKTITPANASNTSVSWSSSNTAIATVVDGLVTAKAVGTATITVTTASGSYTASCVVTVQAATIAVTGVTLNKTSTTLLVNATEQLEAAVTPANASNTSVSWSSSNTAIATVVNGLVTAKAVGSATILVTTADGNKTATCVVTVQAATIAVTGVSLNKTTTTLSVNATEQLTETVAPANATNKNVSWSSSNTAVATVVNGLVTAKTVGTATITVATVDGSKTATCLVTVQAAAIAVTGVSLNKTTTTLSVTYTEVL
jgi:uncharacterized protein YjdB